MEGEHLEMCTRLDTQTTKPNTCANVTSSQSARAMDGEYHVAGTDSNDFGRLEIV